MLGIEPRQTNLKKARFIAKYFNLPKNKYQLKQMDILGKAKIPNSDIVVVPGVMHHLDDHLKALKKIYEITNELCIIETMVLTDELNSEEIAKQLELEDIVYQDKQFVNQFGIVGFKLESDVYDGATIYPGIVGIPTTQALVLMMKHVGFEKVQVFLSEKQFKNKVFNKKSYREYHSAIVVDLKNNGEKGLKFQKAIEQSEENIFDIFIPFEIINDLYKKVNHKSNRKLGKISNLIYESELFFKTKKGENAVQKLKKMIGNKKYYNLILTIKHAPYEKICYEYSKTCYHLKKFDEAEKVCFNLIKILNLDWRVVYSTYFLLAKINFDLKNYNKAKKFNSLSLKANPKFLLSKNLMNKIKKYHSNHI
ncbi:hypothetical protein [Nitrosopumilus ureiphilus]|uniref:hypothetical protein n=1 Tax=Nitrosopumilus ureiphilus TaxID=1470067 RepID=UPI0015C8D7D7|nr:hypothetical protein [Nitrosopumilus ureiphilus]